MRSHGQWVRLIPSLGGRLYKFDGESIDPLAVSADSLLQSSFQMSDDLLITGARPFLSLFCSLLISLHGQFYILFIGDLIGDAFH